MAAFPAAFEHVPHALNRLGHHQLIAGAAACRIRAVDLTPPAEHLVRHSDLVVAEGFETYRDLRHM